MVTPPNRPTADAEAMRAWNAAATVTDPEIPVLSIEDLGILREARIDGDRAIVTITPTYSGCPAMDTITAELREALSQAGFFDPRIDITLVPAWTTDWMTEEGKRKLEEYGIAPPTCRTSEGPTPLTLSVRCPHCGSTDTREITRFGSTSCKALYACRSCREPFDYFKVH